MFRLTIITASSVDTLMVSGAITFQETFKIDSPEKLNKVFLINEDFVNRFGQMKTCFGFNEEKRDLILNHLRGYLSKQAIITTKWLSTTNPKNQSYLMETVKCLNSAQALTLPQSKLLKKYGIQINEKGHSAPPNSASDDFQF